MITIPNEALTRVATRLITLERTCEITSAATAGRRVSKEREINKARYDEACRITAEFGLAMTETETWFQISTAIAAADATGLDWRGKLGAVIDKTWLNAAVNALVAEWVA